MGWCVKYGLWIGEKAMIQPQAVPYTPQAYFTHPIAAESRTLHTPATLSNGVLKAYFTHRFCPPPKNVLYPPEPVLYPPEPVLYPPKAVLYTPDLSTKAPAHLSETPLSDA